MNKYIISNTQTPYYIIDESLVEKNLKILQYVKERTGCKILLAQKAFSCFHFYPLIARYLDGVTASGLFEAKLGYEEFITPPNKYAPPCGFAFLRSSFKNRSFYVALLHSKAVFKGKSSKILKPKRRIFNWRGNNKKENHVFSPAYREEEFDEILNICDHIVFNSFSQVEKFKNKINDTRYTMHDARFFGLRINPEVKTQQNDMYDPCAPLSRMGVRIDDVEANQALLNYVSGFHFHTLCEQNSDALELTLAGVEEKFAPFFDKIKWLNFGGGHHITRDDYDIEKLIGLILHFKNKYNLEIYLEPGEAVVLNAGFLVSSVLDIVHNKKDIAILDTSAACHMPDVLEVPYTPRAQLVKQIADGRCEMGDVSREYRLAGPTCLAGDVIGDYTFNKRLNVGDKLVFEDMALYTIVKNNTFNGMALPAIYSLNLSGKHQKVKDFGYLDFKKRLG
jgi:carboxynorspermidine decarboxylase